MVRNLFHTILHLGIEEGQMAHDKRRIKTINLLNSLVAFFLLVGLYNHFVLHTKMRLELQVFFIAACLFSLYLSKIKKTDLSFLVFTVNVNFSMFTINEMYPIEVGCYLFYFPIIVSVVLLNDPSIRNKTSLLHFGICLFFFVAGLVIDVPPWRVTGLTQNQIMAMLYTNIGISVVVTALLSGLLNRVISSQNHEILSNNGDLQRTRDELNTSLKEKEVLLAELHHRVKNNLAIISGLLNLQEDSTDNDDAKQIIGDSKARITSMALVHKMLYEQSDLKSIDIGKYASELIRRLMDSYNLGQKIKLVEEYENVALPVNKLVPLGLILNEIITNCIKYVFKLKAENGNTFYIRIEQINGFVYLKIKDSGQGFPQDFNQDTDTRSLGIYLIKTLAEQIDGRVHFSNENGAKIELIFSLN